MNKTRIILLSILAVLLAAYGGVFLIHSNLFNSSASQKDIDRISSSWWRQYPLSLRNGLERMSVNGVSIENVRFEGPRDFSNIDDVEYAVFHPRGGGNVFQIAPSDLMKSREKGDWVYNSDLRTRNQEDGEPLKLSLIAYLIGVTEIVCKVENDEESIPRLKSDQSNFYSKNMVGNYVVPSEIRLLDHPDLVNHQHGCFQSYDGNNYVFYSVLFER